MCVRARVQAETEANERHCSPGKPDTVSAGVGNCRELRIVRHVGESVRRNVNHRSDTWCRHPCAYRVLVLEWRTVYAMAYFFVLYGRYC